MTRINLVDPNVLSKKHLGAEFYELPRVFTAVRKAIAAGQTPEDIAIPRQFVLGKGHTKFFYNKINYLEYRIRAIFTELCLRGGDPDWDKVSLMLKQNEIIGGEWRRTYRPEPREIYLSMARLCKRSNFHRVHRELRDET